MTISVSKAVPFAFRRNGTRRSADAAYARHAERYSERLAPIRRFWMRARTPLRGLPARGAGMPITASARPEASGSVRLGRHAARAGSGPLRTATASNSRSMANWKPSFRAPP